ncbi:TIM barrel protein [Rhizobium leguminosarum bv. viciae]|uniref:TIM barrel protein n=1 Tax=Rhizobium leguminosarum bv. viciae TaxID=387 RepID=A0A8I2GJ85_RHILV|nr:sugar phosphate isomerase/epimerase [Rhizobium leguminosarum]MBY5791627.1 sugar phosphate isomerase/epimerase [Rhizobium leguminosarum]NKM43579.1 TIM barrel protein [Rhizobium leguminosarum bv. viciae]
MTKLVQMYSARNFTPWPAVLDEVRKNGFDGVEGYSANYEEPESFRFMLDERELTMPQGHFDLAMLETDVARAFDIARKLRIETIIVPWLAPDRRPVDYAGWHALGLRLAAIGQKVTAEGFGFAWHNHDFELKSVEGGAIPMEILLEAAPGIGWEADLGWILRAGRDPLTWLDAYAERIISVHIKDLQENPDAALEGGWADLGHGVNEWAPIFSKLKVLPQLQAYVAEHDDPADFSRFLRRWSDSFERLRE